MRLTIAIITLGMLIAISSSAALAVNSPIHPDHYLNWLANAQSHMRHAPEADTPRSQWIVQSARDSSDSHDRLSKWIKSSDNSCKSIAAHYKSRDDFQMQSHYQFRDLNGNLAAVPEPSGFAALAGPSFAALLCWRRRRSA